MEDNKTYFGEIGHGLKTLAIGMKTTWKEYFKDFFTNKSTEQYPENRKTTLHVAKRHRGRLTFKRNDDGSYKCTACTLCEKACPNGTIKITAHMAEDPETGKKKKVLDDYQYDLGDCMFCQLCTNACNFDAIEFTNDFENAVFDRSKLVLHLNQEVYQGGSLPNLIEGVSLTLKPSNAIMGNIVMFCILAVVIIASALLCVTTTKIMRAATFMLFVLFGVAGIYFLLDYTFLGAAQISVYAGGVTMIYVFAIQLVSKRTLQGLEERVKSSKMIVGGLAAFAGLVVVSLILLKTGFITHEMANVEVPMKEIGTALVGSGKYQYVLPFEFISVFLLACIIGGLVVARKEDKQ